MNRKHCIRAAIGRRSTRASSCIGPVVTFVRHCSRSWRNLAADFASVVFVLPAPPTILITIHCSIETRGEGRAPRLDD